MGIWDGVSEIITRLYDDLTGETARKHREKEEEISARRYEAWAKHEIACGLYQVADAIAERTNARLLVPEERRSAVSSDLEPTIDMDLEEASH